GRGGAAAKSAALDGGRTTESLTAEVETAVLLLRLGIAVNAIRAAQRFFHAFRDAPGPAGERDRLWSFLIALGFLQEAIRTVLNRNFPRIKELAQAGGAQDDLIKDTGALLSGKLPFSKMLGRLRDKVVFHWDEDPIRDSVTR